jgi:DNA-directed RNA polymerase subunit RPC12/RpoP
MTKHIPYGLRSIFVCMALPLFPSLSILLDNLEWLPKFNDWIHIVWILGSLYLWARFSRYMLVTAPYICSSCGKAESYISAEEGERQTLMFYDCRACGYRESSGVAQHGDGGG